MDITNTLTMGAPEVNLTPETVAELCLKKYRDLPKTGKPTRMQWSVLAGVVLRNALENCSQVVALGLGTKCIGGSKICGNGLIVNDSHAEVLSRRGLIRYLYYQIKQTSLLEQSNSILAWNSEGRVYRLKPEYSFHFFSTQSPCGDACILEETTATEETIPTKRRRMSQEKDVNKESNVGKALAENVIYTGAKLFGQDNISGDRMAQTKGALRIKPGKGNQTLSMSCSDKLSKWNLMGVQGALLSILLENPIYFSSMTFMQDTNVQALRRAIYERWKDKTQKFEYKSFRQHEPSLRICDKSVVFDYAHSTNRNQPCPNGLVWCDVPDKLNAFEVIVNGKRQGCTKKTLDTPESALKISKYFLFQSFIDVLRENKDVLNRCNLMGLDLTTLSYCDAKNLAKTYQEAWISLRNETFGLWVQKPVDILNFSVSSVSNVVGSSK